MELGIGYKLPVVWHLGPNNYSPATGVFHPGTTAVGPVSGSYVDADQAFSEGRGAILIAQPEAGPWEADLIDGVGALTGAGGSSHMWMSPSICEGGNERWVIAMGRTGLNELGQDLSTANTWSPYHQEGTTPGYGHVLYGDDGREPRFFKSDSFAGKTASQISMMLVEMAQYVSDNLLTASGAYPAFSRTLGGATTPAQFENNARAWFQNNAVAIMNDYLNGCGGGETTTTTTARGGETTTTTTATPATTTTTTAAATTTTTTAAATTTTTTSGGGGEPQCNCYDLVNQAPEAVTLDYTNCLGLADQVIIPAQSGGIPGTGTMCAQDYDRTNPLLDSELFVTMNTINPNCIFDGEVWTCCPVYNINWIPQGKQFTIDCITIGQLITLIVTDPQNLVLTLGSDYNISWDPESGCLIITIGEAKDGTYNFTINGCNYSKNISTN